jgi:hypothetical protein
MIGRLRTAMDRRLRRWAREAERRSREAQERRLPRPQLRAEHVAGCRVVLDRAALLDLLPKGGSIAELGVDQGDFSALILERCRPRVLHLVDAWHTERYSESKQDAVAARFAGEIARGTVRIHCSLSIDAAAAFAPGTLDWVYIDTTHRYDTTRDELRAYEPLIRPDGYIAGHDYSLGNWTAGLRYGVIEAVQEFCVERRWRLCFLTARAGESPSFTIQRLAHTAPTSPDRR